MTTRSRFSKFKLSREPRYAALAEDLKAVADHVGATQALGVSMGAGALCRLLAHTPGRFERLVFVMPAALDQPRTDDGLNRMLEMAHCVENRDVQTLTALLLEAEPVGVRNRTGVELGCRRQAAAMVGTEVAQALRALSTTVPKSVRRLAMSARQHWSLHRSRTRRTRYGLLSSSRPHYQGHTSRLWRLVALCGATEPV